MSVLNHSLLLGADAGAAYQISRSLRFNRADTASLSRTPGTASNRTTWTWSGWVKRTAFGENGQTLFTGGTNGSNSTRLAFDTSNRLVFENEVSGVTTQFRVTTAVYRDPSAWMHIVLDVDTTDATAANRVRLWVNGIEVTTWTTNNAVTQNLQLQVNAATVHYMGQSFTPAYANFYLAQVQFVDGLSLTASNFGEFDANGVWQHKIYSGSYGTNGFRLDFSDNSAATATAVGKDRAGSNNWTPSGFTVSSFSGATFVSAGTSVASGGTIANGGTPYWVDVLPTNANLAYSGAMSNVHDGNLSSNTYWVGDEYSTGNVLRARLDLRDFPTVTSVRVYANGYGAGYVDYVAQLLDASKVAIAGTSVALSPTTAQWITVPVSGTPRFLEFSCTSGGSRRLNLYEIEVNGIVLANGPGYTTDSFVDSPSSPAGQTDSGVGGTVSGNYATFSPITPSGMGMATLSDGNLTITGITGVNYTGCVSTFAMASGKWYCEYTVTNNGSVSGAGIVSTASLHLANGSYGYPQASDAWYRVLSQINSNGTTTVTGLSSIGAGDIINIAVDIDAGRLWFGKNGTWELSGNPAAGTGATVTFTPGGKSFYVFAQGYASSGIWSGRLNAGGTSFAFTAPTGFKSLCTANITTPITNPATAMDVVTYAGDSNNNRLITTSISPDLVWVKSRSGYEHVVNDSVRGAGLALFPNLTNAEQSQNNRISALGSNGFTVGNGASQEASTNSAGTSYVAWCWDAGSSTVTNTAGSITSQVRANPNAGFSIVNWTSTATGTHTKGHGLGVTPSFIVAKNRNLNDNWWIYHVGGFFYFTTAGASAGGGWVVSSTTFTNTESNIANVNGQQCIAYCWAPVAGYSAFGTYSGNNNADGPVVYTGFRPRWILIKSTAASTQWVIIDSSRIGYNADNNALFVESTTVESTADLLDITSNGFKLRAAGNNVNAANTHIYCAFAESPFALARAR